MGTRAKEANLGEDAIKKAYALDQQELTNDKIVKARDKNASDLEEIMFKNSGNNSREENNLKIQRLLELKDLEEGLNQVHHPYRDTGKKDEHLSEKRQDIALQLEYRKEQKDYIESQMSNLVFPNSDGEKIFDIFRRQFDKQHQAYIESTEKYHSALQAFEAARSEAMSSNHSETPTDPTNSTQGPTSSGPANPEGNSSTSGTSNNGSAAESSLVKDYADPSLEQPSYMDPED
jgi:hypothetical protein